MKKILMMVLVVLFIELPSGATTFVHYNMAGQPTHMTMGAGHVRSINNFGSNAAFTPENRMMAGERMRMRRLQQMAVARSGMARVARPLGGRTAVVTPVQPPVQISRLSRNYRVPPRTRVVRNGIICYE